MVIYSFSDGFDGQANIGVKKTLELVFNVDSITSMLTKNVTELLNVVAG